MLSDDSSGLMVAGWKCGRSHVAGLTVGGTRRPCCTLGHKTSPPACWKFLACLWSLMHGSKVICYWDWVKCRRTRRLWEADEESVAESGWDETAEWQRVALHLLACTPQLLSRKPAAQAVLLQGTHHHHLLLIERQRRGGDNPKGRESKKASCHQDQTKPHITINSSYNDYIKPPLEGQSLEHNYKEKIIGVLSGQTLGLRSHWHIVDRFSRMGSICLSCEMRGSIRWCINIRVTVSDCNSEREQ